MKCQSLFSENYKNNIMNLLSAELAQRVAKVKLTLLCLSDLDSFFRIWL